MLIVETGGHFLLGKNALNGRKSFKKYLRLKNCQSRNKLSCGSIEKMPTIKI